MISFIFVLQAPLNTTNYLLELDKIAQDIVNQIIAIRKVGVLGPIVINNETNLKVLIPPQTSAGDLNRLKRQFLNLTKQHSGTSLSNLDQVPILFVQFLNANLNF